SDLPDGGSFQSGLESSRSTRHHGLVERVQRDRRFVSPVRPYRNRQVENSLYSAAYLSPPPDASWRRCSLITVSMETSSLFSDQLSLPSSRPKSCEVPGINIFTSPEQPSTPVQGVPQVPNTGGSLPDLSSLHFPSPLPTPLDQDEPGYPASSALSGGSSTGNLASTLTQMGINASLSTSPRRRAQLSPLILPMAGESRRIHPKQFSPTMSPTLSSISQFPAESPVDCLNHSGPGQNQFPSNSQGALELQEPCDPQRLNHQNQNRNYSSGDGRQNVPNIILTGDSPPGLSKEITSALSHVPGFEMDAFSLDEPLRIDPLALDLLEGELMLADPAVEDSFRSDRLK
uniref:CREB regulated transcription coactivator 2 n=1 Tax=Poecilia reticulata TaxID=8081 RepID=A0A3P9PJN1_POERE